MGLAERLERYEVTAVPGGSRGLRLVWSAPEDAVPDPPGGQLGDPEDDTSDGAKGRRSGAVILPLLSSYRITRVPGRAAS